MEKKNYKKHLIFNPMDFMRTSLKLSPFKRGESYGQRVSILSRKNYKPKDLNVLPSKEERRKAEEEYLNYKLKKRNADLQRIFDKYGHEDLTEEVDLSSMKINKDGKWVDLRGEHLNPCGFKFSKTTKRYLRKLQDWSLAEHLNTENENLPDSNHEMETESELWEDIPEMNCQEESCYESKKDSKLLVTSSSEVKTASPRKKLALSKTENPFTKKIMYQHDISSLLMDEISSVNSLSTIGNPLIENDASFVCTNNNKTSTGKTRSASKAVSCSTPTRALASQQQEGELYEDITVMNCKEESCNESKKDSRLLVTSSSEVKTASPRKKLALSKTESPFTKKVMYQHDLSSLPVDEIGLVNPLSTIGSPLIENDASYVCTNNRTSHSNTRNASKAIGYSTPKRALASQQQESKLHENIQVKNCKEETCNKYKKDSKLLVTSKSEGKIASPLKRLASSEIESPVAKKFIYQHDLSSLPVDEISLVNSPSTSCSLPIENNASYVRTNNNKTSTRKTRSASKAVSCSTPTTALASQHQRKLIETSITLQMFP